MDPNRAATESPKPSTHVSASMTTPRRKACVECRQQKIRCDVEQHKTPHEKCSRCKKMDLDCRILPTSTRNLRQTKAEMRRELEELKWNMRHDPSHAIHQTPTTSAGPGPDGHVNHSPLDHAASTFSSGRTERSMSPAYATATGTPTHSLSAQPTSQPVTSTRGTLPRVMEGFVVDARRIDECFALFFAQYHPLLPILDSTRTPNEIYELSPFLFWAIIVTGSRRYAADPSILDKTSQLITPLAFSSMALRSTPIPVIQGLLILCTWRLPTNSLYKDMTHVLCGAALHLATQIGLHIAGIGQDFARMPLKKNQDQKILRTRLWMHCVIVSVGSSCAEGIPPLVIADTFFDGDEREKREMAAYLPADLLFMHKINVILLRAMNAICKIDLKAPNIDSGALRSLISIFDAELVNLASGNLSEEDHFHVCCARVHILAFQFFTNPSSPDYEALSRLFSLCVSTLQKCNNLSNSSIAVMTGPSFVDRTITLAGFCILKLVRSPLAQHLDLTMGEQAYFYAVNFNKNMSLQNGDIGARVASILANLWNSTKVFRNKDGTMESLGLRLRTRLSMSVSFDLFWYWREEFGRISNPYNGEEPTHHSDNAQAGAASPPYAKNQDNTNTRQPTAAQAQPQPEMLPVTKFTMDQLNNSNIQAPVDMGTWNPAYNNMPMIDTFPDYEWAASFDFPNEWPNAPMQQIPPEMAGFEPTHPMQFG